MYRLLLLLLLPLPSLAQSSPYQFTVVKDNTAGAVENQCATGTCWSFATISFLESEIQRKGGQIVDLSEMFNVRMTYPKKVESYLRYQGKQQFSMGGLSHDVFDIVHEYGLMPEEAYTGNAVYHDHSTLDALLEGMVQNILDKKLYVSNQEWKKAMNGILDGMLGTAPSEFLYGGKKYTAQTFRDAMGIRTEDYVGLTSFTHRPYYSPMVVEVPDNWSHASYLNVPMTEMIEVMDHALKNGYTISWDADVSEPGFSFSQGIAVMPVDEIGKNQFSRTIISELKPDAALRQDLYERQETTDDHLMHITGLAKDQQGNEYYIIKNSWGSSNPYKGFQYISKSYFYYKTISIYVHKDGIPVLLKKKFGM